MKIETHVKEIIQRTHNVKSFRFPRPPWFVYKPGQYMLVTIKAAAGRMTKPFTISSSPTEKAHLEFTKKLTGHEYSNALDVLRPGDWAMLDAPHGSFTYEGEFGRIAMLSGGIGITPLRSICRYCTDSRLGTSIVLLYGNQTEADIVFREELEEMQRSNRNLKVIFTLEQPGESWTGLNGRITGEMVRREVADYSERIFYICGPPVMVEAMVETLKSIELPENRIKKERFPNY